MDLFTQFGQVKDVRMIKDYSNLNNLNDVYKAYAFIEFFELENAKKALNSLNKGEISLRGEILSGNYSKRVEDQIGNNNIGNTNEKFVKIILII